MIQKEKLWTESVSGETDQQCQRSGLIDVCEVDEGVGLIAPR